MVRYKPESDIVVMIPISEKLQECYRAGQYIKNLLAKDIKPRYVKFLLLILKGSEKNILPRDILTQNAFENAITIVNVLGGSTNAVCPLHSIL